MTYTNPSNPDRDRYQPTTYRDYLSLVGGCAVWILTFFILAPLVLGVIIVGMMKVLEWVSTSLLG